MKNNIPKPKSVILAFQYSSNKILFYIFIFLERNISNK